MPVPDSTIQTKSFKAKKIKISNEWWRNLSETTGLPVEEIAKRKHKKYGLVDVTYFLKCIDICRKKNLFLSWNCA